VHKGDFFFVLVRDDKWLELVDKMDVANDVGLGGLGQALLKGLGALASSRVDR
jgi:hypothetical protein